MAAMAGAVANVGSVANLAEVTGELDFPFLVVDAYGGIDGISLSQITHAPETPWSSTFNSGWGDVIPTDLIANHYRILLHKARANAGQRT